MIVGGRRSSRYATARTDYGLKSVRTAVTLLVVGVAIQVTVGRRDISLVPLAADAPSATYAIEADARAGNYVLRITGISEDALRQLQVVPVGAVRDADNVALDSGKDASGDAKLLRVEVVASPGTFKLALPGYRPFATVRAAPAR